MHDFKLSENIIRRQYIICTCIFKMRSSTVVLVNKRYTFTGRV
jgi:hypothetical protein